MQRHPFFDLWMHDDAELAVAIGSPISRRAVIQEGPLSRVERVTCVDGQTRIYKVQGQPSVEPEFYARATSPILVRAQPLACPAAPQAPAALLLEDVSAPRLSDVRVPADRALAIIDDVVRQIGQVQGDLPVLGDLRGVPAWHERADSIAADLQALVDGGALPGVSGALVEQFARVSRSELIDAALATPHGYVHFDLLANNVLVLEDGYRVLDWQRPVWGPVALDRASLLGRLRISETAAGGSAASDRPAALEAITQNPRAYVPPGIHELRNLLMIGWLAEQARRWFPAGAARCAPLMLRMAAELPGH